MTENVDVIISGAGPVGMFFAYQMLAKGHSVYICDKKPGPTDQSRAILLTARTIEVLDNHRIARHFLHRALVLQGIQAHVQGRKVGALSVSGETPYPQLTSLIQDQTEEVFVDILTKKGLRIHWETELIQYKQDHDGVEAVVRPINTNDSSLERTIRGRYIIGADGCHSAVRKLAKDWHYDGTAISTKFALGDFAVSGPDATRLKNFRMNVFYHSKGLCGLIPLGIHHGQDYYRLVCNLEEYKHESDDVRERQITHGVDRERFTLQDIQKVMNDRTAPFKVIARDPIWISLFRINERLADGFRRSRAFVVGDAAHCHSPVGGQGLNLGLQDADNLSWKLSLVLNHLSSDPEMLLDTYSTERLPIAKHIIQTTGAATRVGTMGGIVMAAIRYVIMYIAMSFPSLTRRSMQTVLQLDTHIDKRSPLLVRSSKRLLAAGLFLPESGILTPRVLTGDLDGFGVRATLRELIANGNRKTTLLWVATRPSSCVSCPWTADFWNKAGQYSPEAVYPLIIESTWHAQDHKVPDYIPEASRETAASAFWLESKLDHPDSVTKRIGLTRYLSGEQPPAALVIIRPDLYIIHSHLVYSPKDIDDALKSLHYLKPSTDVN